MLIRTGIILIILSVFADSSDIKVFQVVFKRNKENSVILSFKAHFSFQFFCPLFRRVRPISLPLTETPGVSDFKQFKWATFKWVDIYQRIGMGIYQANILHVLSLFTLILRRNSSCHDVSMIISVDYFVPKTTPHVWTVKFFMEYVFARSSCKSRKSFSSCSCFYSLVRTKQFCPCFFK